jgi:tetratricopeptide (TPR) repeat protein
MLALLAFREGRGDEAIPWIEESLRILRATEPDKVGPALLFLCQAHLLSGENERAADIAKQALQMAEDLGDGRAIAVALDAAGNVALVSGQFDDARRYFEQSAAMTEELDDRQLLAAVLHNLACALMELGLVDEAVRALRRSLRISRDVGFRLELVYCLEACAALLVSTAEYRSAARLVGAAERVAELERVVVAEPYEAATQRKARAALEDELGAAEFAAARAVGRMLSAEAALDEALTLLDELSVSV